MAEKPNIVLVVSDTLRLDHLGCYGNPDIRTPNIDRLARESAVFTNAFPESLPTIPVRRALHTGRRAYPFRDYGPVKWDIVYLPGWQPIDDSEDTLAENLAGGGYQTGFVTDTLPYFAPGFNFTRGFYQWDFIRGQQQDRWRSPYTISEEMLGRYGDPEEIGRDMHSIIPMHLANTAHVSNEGETTTALTFKSGIRFLEENRRGQPFYLLVDCFDPHEPWDPPEDYLEMYLDRGYQGPDLLYLHYGPAGDSGYTDREIEYVRAKYCAHVSLVDNWLGLFLEKMDDLGLTGNTAVFLTSDHGTNFGENPLSVVGKPSYSMYPAVMRLPLIARIPWLGYRGERFDQLVYDHDITATIYDLAGLTPGQSIDGHSLIPILKRDGNWKNRGYMTCRYGHDFAYIDRRNWVLCDIDGNASGIFDLENDPECRVDLGDEADPAITDLAWKRLKLDAGGELPDYREKKRTDAIGIDD